MSQPAEDSPPEEWPPEGRDTPLRGDTRSRIQAVAVELFSEQGYEKTSLREIAERLGVTKAALYYHFKSKEDIVHSLVDDYFGQMDSLVVWASQQPRTAAVRAEILSRYLDMVIDSHQVYRMLQQNQAALAGLKSAKHGGELFRERMNALVDLLVEPGAALRERVRAAVAATGLSIGWMLFHDQVDDPAELRSAVLDIAFELAGGQAGACDQPGEAGAPAEAADQPGEAGPGPAWPPAAARTNGSTR
jgi:AcrR family transcriptional regulator